MFNWLIFLIHLSKAHKTTDLRTCSSTGYLHRNLDDDLPPRKKQRRIRYSKKRCVRQLLAKQEFLDKSLHMRIVEDPDTEDEAPGVHEDEIAELALRVQRLVSCSSSTGSDGARKSSACKLPHLEKNLDSPCLLSPNLTAMSPLGAV